jgi:hypothetical protein
MTRQTSEATRYIIQVGNNRFRRETWDSLKDICAIENTPMADEIWCALDAHVSEYAKSDKAQSKYVSKRPMGGPSPDFSLPENNNIFDKMVDEIVAEATEEEVEEVVNEPSGEKRRMATSDMFGHYRKA